MNNKTKRKIKHYRHITVIAITFIISIITQVSNVYASEISSNNIVQIINKERKYRGIPPLIVDDKLSLAATKKSNDMINRDYFEHYAFGLTPWSFIKAENYDYLLAGENLAMDFDTSEGIVRAWMNSKKHRDNILNSDFKDTGIGVVRGVYTEDSIDRDTYMVTNLFAREKPTVLKIIDKVMSYLSRVF